MHDVLEHSEDPFVSDVKFIGGCSFEEDYESTKDNVEKNIIEEQCQDEEDVDRCFEECLKAPSMASMASGLLLGLQNESEKFDSQLGEEELTDELPSRKSSVPSSENAQSRAVIRRNTSISTKRATLAWQQMKRRCSKDVPAYHPQLSPNHSW